MGRAVRSAGGCDPQTREEWRDLSLHQLQHDALWGSAWLNLGISDAANDELSEALPSFVAATMLMPADLETWERAIVTALLLDDRQILTDLVVSGRRLAGDELVPSLLDNLAHPDSSMSRAQAAAAIDKILSAQPEASRRKTAVRVLSEGGQVEEFVLDP